MASQELFSRPESVRSWGIVFPVIALEDSCGAKPFDNLNGSLFKMHQRQGLFFSHISSITGSFNDGCMSSDRSLKEYSEILYLKVACEFCSENSS